MASFWGPFLTRAFIKNATVSYPFNDLLMKNRVIKVIKPGAESSAPPAPSAEAVLNQQKQEKAEDDRELASAVKGWISERRENSRVADSDASESRRAWHKNNGSGKE